MEYSLARSLEGYSDVVNSAYPRINSDPACDLVNPGLAQVVNLYETIVPIRGHSLHSIEKKVPTDEIKTNVTEHLSEQMGSGDKKIDPEILSSFQKPIVTDAIIFPKIEKIEKKTASKRLTINEKTPSKRMKTEHKFKVV